MTFTTEGKLLTAKDSVKVTRLFSNLMAEIALTRERLDRDRSLGRALRRAIATKNLPDRERQALMHLVNKGERLFFAGEATSRAHYGTAPGAFLSGWRAALSITDPAAAAALIAAEKLKLTDAPKR